jgi:hypothetical protein
VAYTSDGLERRTPAKRGTWGGGSITSPFHDEQWALGHGSAPVDANGCLAAGTPSMSAAGSA